MSTNNHSIRNLASEPVLHNLLRVQIDLQYLLPLLVGCKLDSRVWDDARHRGRIAPPQGQESFANVRVSQEPERCPKRVRDVLAGVREWRNGVGSERERVSERERTAM